MDKKTESEDIYKSTDKGSSLKRILMIISTFLIGCFAITTRFAIRSGIIWDAIFESNQQIAETEMEYTEEGVNNQSAAMLESFDLYANGIDEDTKQMLFAQFQNVMAGDSLDVAIASLTPYYERAIDKEHYDDIDYYAEYIGWFLSIAHYKEGDNYKAKTILINVYVESKDRKMKKKITDLIKFLSI